jgi:hypothetical protein
MIRNKTPPPEQLLALLEAAIREAPPFVYQEELTDSDMRWLGRADALLEASGGVPALVSFRTARHSLGGYNHSREKLLIPLHDAYSRMELFVPAALQGAFIPGGDTWNGYAAIVKIMQLECDDLLVVDPYLNSVIYTDLAPHTVAKKGVRCITSRRTENHAALFASSKKWLSDPISANRPVEVRYAPSSTLHDRLIIVDEKQVWLVSQSLKDIAKRSPASVSRADGELAEMKVRHYNDLWLKSISIA